MNLTLWTCLTILCTVYVTSADNPGDIDSSLDEFDSGVDDLYKRAHKPIYVGKRTFDLQRDNSLDALEDSALASDLDSLKRELSFLVKDNPFEQSESPFQREIRYKPRIVGRSDEASEDGGWMDKRRSPLFVGKRRVPIFVGKRRMHLIVGRGMERAPKFVGKRRSPLFVGRRSYGRNNKDPVFSYVVMRR